MTRCQYEESNFKSQKQADINFNSFSGLSMNIPGPFMEFFMPSRAGLQPASEGPNIMDQVLPASQAPQFMCVSYQYKV